MTKFSSLISIRSAKVAAVCASALLSVGAHADVKMVSRVTVTTSMGTGQQPPQTITAYFRQGMMRSDTGDTSTIVNTKTHETLVLDRTNKTYSKMTVPGANGSQNGMMKGMKLTVTGGVKPTNEKKTIAGKAARKYNADFLILISVPQLKGQQQKLKMHLEQWATTAIPAVLSPAQMIGTMGSMLKGLSGMEGMNTMMKEMSKIKGFPLDNKTTMTVSFSLPPGQQRPQGMPSTLTFGFQNQVLSLKEGPVDAALFKIPAGYKLSATPVSPKLGGM